MVVEAVQENLKTTISRLCAIESKPGKRWEQLVSEFIKLIAAAAFGYFLSKS